MATYILMAHLDRNELDVEGCGSYRVYEGLLVDIDMDGHGML
jgi:hypothetical protein